MNSLPEYTILTLISLIIFIFIDLFSYKKITQKKFWVFIAFVFVLHTIFDNYLNGRWGFGYDATTGESINDYIVGNYNFYSKIKIWHTPIENYFFGFSLILLNLNLYDFFVEKFVNKSKLADSQTSQAATNKSKF